MPEPSVLCSRGIKASPFETVRCHALFLFSRHTLQFASSWRFKASAQEMGRVLPFYPHLVCIPLLPRSNCDIVLYLTFFCTNMIKLFTVSSQISLAFCDNLWKILFCVHCITFGGKKSFSGFHLLAAVAISHSTKYLIPSTIQSGLLLTFLYLMYMGFTYEYFLFLIIHPAVNNIKVVPCFFWLLSVLSILNIQSHAAILLNLLTFVVGWQ